ncbi:MAG: hypothetical protein Q8R92_01410 [Deltaproteobacteria bacterium]|nr:hypothetical protein [Deltaproteobacteria bacterium]
MAVSGDARHAVAIIGGATAGAEVAGSLARRGVETVVFEQNDRPYGKIEDGLPRWHVELRKKEYRLIDQKLSLPGVHFVPRTKIGRDIPFEELVKGWGFTGVILAVGAWRDRPLAVPGVDAYVGRGLVYQNPFIYWFNHSVEKGYDGPVFEILDDAIVVGGGLASIDVVKALQIETTRQALAARGIEEEVLTLEVEGIPDVLAKHGLAWEALGLQGCTLYYRRREEDMPLVEAPPGADAARLAKVAQGRRKILEKAMRKYLFKVCAQLAPKDVVVEGNRLVGLVFQRTRIQDGKIVEVPGETVEARGSMVVSSIGSVPEPLGSIPMKGELYCFTDWKLGRFENYEHVFSAGNVVTGKGNIVASRKHGAVIAAHVIERFLGLDSAGHAGEEAMAAPAREAARETAEVIAREITGRPPLPAATLSSIRERVRRRQNEIGYGDDYNAWIKQVTPPDMV